MSFYGGLGMKPLVEFDIYERSQQAYKDRKFLYLFPNANGNYFAVNYDAINCELNSFLTLFDVWGNKSGHHKVSEDGNHQEVWFEVDEEFFKLATETMTFNRAFKNLGIEVVTEYPFSKKKDEWSEDWRGMAKAVKTLFEWEEGRMIYENVD